MGCLDAKFKALSRSLQKNRYKLIFFTWQFSGKNYGMLKYNMK